MLVRGIIFSLSGLLLAGCMQSGPAWDANFTARDRQELANPPYKQARIPPAYQRQVVQYDRKEPPGSILVDTDARYV
jgi:lipoprotein-anchoring transpeptidase ErfK/SrfK